MYCHKHVPYSEVSLHTDNKVGCCVHIYAHPPKQCEDELSGTGQLTGTFLEFKLEHLILLGQGHQLKQHQ